MKPQKNAFVFKKNAFAFTSTAFSLAALLLSVHPAAAQTPAIGFTPNAYGVTDNASDSGAASYSLGFEFTASSPLFVTSLGYFSDPSFNPSAPFNTVSLSPEPTGGYTFAAPHQVGLYQVVPGVGTLPATGLLLAQTTVTKSSTANGDFLYSPLTLAVPLLPGTSYVLAGTTGSTDPFVFNIEDDTRPNAVGLTTSGITYVQDVSTASSTLTFPGTADAGAGPGIFGPNMLTTAVAPVPEVSTVASLGLLLMLGSLTVVVRRRSRSV